MYTSNMVAKWQALAAFLECGVENIDVTKWSTFEYSKKEYRVLTEDEAKKAISDYVMDALWSFNSDFIASHSPDGIEEEHIAIMRGDIPEKCNDAMIALVNAGSGIEALVDDLIAQDGYGEYLSGADGSEHESPCGSFMIFRTN